MTDEEKVNLGLARKIRELEAELEHSRKAAMSELAQIQNEYFREKARAEKAEARVEDQNEAARRLGPKAYDGFLLYLRSIEAREREE